MTPLEAPYSDSVSETFRRLMPEGMEPLTLFRTMAHNPRVLKRMHRGGLLDPGSISLRQRELTILRTTALCGAEYEWGVHATLFGPSAELEEDDMQATVGGRHDDPRWSHDEQLILRLCDTLHATSQTDDALYDELAACFAPDQIIELVMLAGLYHAVSYVVNTAGVDHEPWGRRWRA